MFKKKPSAGAGPVPAAVSDLAPCEKFLRLDLAPEAVQPVRAGVAAEFQKRAGLPGFRKGKAPLDVVERQYGDAIRDETLRRAMQQAFQQVAKDHHLKPVGPFEVRAAAFTGAGGLHLEATVEVEPAFALGAYKGIPLARPPLTVSPQEIDQALQGLRESMAQLAPGKEGAGEKVRQVPPLDDELAKDLGFTDLAPLRAHVEAKLREQKRAAQAQAVEAMLLDALLARHAFTVPAKLVARQADRLTRDFRARLLLTGMAEEQVSAEAATFVDQLRTSATRHVKLGFIMDRIAEQEQVAVTQEDLVKRLWQLAQRWKKDPAEVRRMFDAQELWPSVVATLRQEKTLALLLAAAAITNGAAASPREIPTPAETPQPTT